MRFIANLLAAIGGNAASAGTQGCFVWVMDEPKMPRSLIER